MNPPQGPWGPNQGCELFTYRLALCDVFSPFCNSCSSEWNLLSNANFMNNTTVTS